MVGAVVSLPGVPRRGRPGSSASSEPRSKRPEQGRGCRRSRAERPRAERADKIVDSARKGRLAGRCGPAPPRRRPRLCAHDSSPARSMRRVSAGPERGAKADETGSVVDDAEARRPGLGNCAVTRRRGGGRRRKRARRRHRSATPPIAATKVAFAVRIGVSCLNQRRVRHSLRRSSTERREVEP